MWKITSANTSGEIDGATLDPVLSDVSMASKDFNAEKFYEQDNRYEFILENGIGRIIAVGESDILGDTEPLFVFQEGDLRVDDIIYTKDLY